MKFDEYIGFIITFLGMVYLMVRKSREGANTDEEKPLPRPSRAPAPVEEPQSLHIYVEPPARKPPAKIAAADKSILPVHMDYHELIGSAESLALPSAIPLEYNFRSDPSRGKVLVDSLSSKADLLILHDLFGSPKGL